MNNHVWIMLKYWETLSFIKFFVLEQLPDIFMKSTTHCKSFYKYFLHTKLRVMRQKWRFIYLVTQNQTQSACLYVTAVIRLWRIFVVKDMQ